MPCPQRTIGNRTTLIILIRFLLVRNRSPPMNRVSGLDPLNISIPVKAVSDNNIVRQFWALLSCCPIREYGSWSITRIDPVWYNLCCSLLLFSHLLLFGKLNELLIRSPTMQWKCQPWQQNDQDQKFITIFHNRRWDSEIRRNTHNDYSCKMGRSGFVQPIRPPFIKQRSWISRFKINKGSRLDFSDELSYRPKTVLDIIRKSRNLYVFKDVSTYKQQ